MNVIRLLINSEFFLGYFTFILGIIFKNPYIILLSLTNIWIFIAMLLGWYKEEGEK